MNDGVKILLERMETHPEEFAYKANEGTSKWGGLLANYKHCFTNEEITAVEEGIKNIERTRFTELVLEGLVDPKPLKDSEIPIRIGQMNAMPSVGQTLASSLMTSKAATMATIATANSLTLGSTTINESHLEHLRAHVDAMKREVDSQTAKQHKTIFGKLFNYS